MSVATALDYHRIIHRIPERPFQGMDAAVNWCIGRYRRRSVRLKELKQQAAQVTDFERAFNDLRDHDLQEKLLVFRNHFRRGAEPPEDILLPALAAIREAAHRCVGLQAFPVQLMGALALNCGILAEMATGEGKTLTAGLAGVLAGWTKRPTHVVTVNDYLAELDANWLRTFYMFCGVRVGCVTGPMDAQAREKEYDRDVTYTTSKELLADFLRDRLQLGTLKDPGRRLIRRLLQSTAVSSPGLVLRGLHTAIIDEADSVLIDEAVTPLIISTPRKNEILREAGVKAGELAQNLEAGIDYTTDLRYKEIELTDEGRRKIARFCEVLPGFWRGEQRRLELVRTALIAREFFQRDRQYVLADEKVVIVDESTGRPMPQRTWREGLHQAIEVKEGIKPSDPSETIARMSFQRFFRCFHRLSGMTGTSWEAAAETWQIYGLPVVRIPTNRPCIRKQFPDRFFSTGQAKWNAVLEETERLHKIGRPVLIGTRTVATSEYLGRQLEAQGLSVQVLNAKRLQEEAMIVTLAGEPGRITIATNMAGRGTDIRLGSGVAQQGGLHVIATERHESARVDRQLFGRAARQGDPGSAQAFISAEDELLQRHLPASVKTLLLSKCGSPFFSLAVKLAQRQAQKLALKQRVGVLRSDAWLDEALAFSGQ